MKVRFLKNHLKWKEGDIANVDNTQAHYWARCCVAEYADDTPEKKEEALLKHLDETQAPEPKAQDKPKAGRKPKAK